MVSKFAPKRKDKLIDKSQITEPIVLIKQTNDYYTTPTGKVYRIYENKYYPRKDYVMYKGYRVITLVTKNGHKKTFRVHRLVAEAYIPNPNNYPLVGHKDNIKINCCVQNLYWTTNQKNIQKAHDDKLIINAKGYEDSQSHPVSCYDLNHNFIRNYGSVCECHKDLKISISTITRHCKGEIKTKSRCGYYFEFQK